MKRRELIKLGCAAAFGYFSRGLAQPLSFAAEGISLTLALGQAGSETATVRLRKLTCRWEPRKKNKYICDLSVTEKRPYEFTELYANGQRQIRARFPDMHLDGTNAYITAVGVLPANTIRPDFLDSDGAGQDVFALVFDPETFSKNRWAKPEEAILHVYRGAPDRELELQMKAIDYDRNLLWCAKGNLKNPTELGATVKFYVENIAEDLTMPGEWYLNKETGTLTYLPASTTDMSTAVFEVPSQERESPERVDLGSEKGRGSKY